MSEAMVEAHPRAERPAPSAPDRRYSAMRELTLWRVREFLREPEAVFWVFAFPVLLAFALGIAFKNRGPQPVRIAVESGSPAAAAMVAMLESDPTVKAEVVDPAAAQNELRTGKVQAVVV